MAYTPNPPRVVQEMLEAMGLGDIDQLFIDIPGELQLDRELDLGESLSELELRKKMSELAGRNMTTGEYPCFLGAGAYDHYVPAVVEHVLSRSEFVTAYTPYQAELSQGVLQSIFEYQSMICTLTGMDVCNASMFDGGSSVAEACSLAVDATRRKKVVIASTINPRYLEVVKTYTHGKGIEVVVIPGCDGAVDADEMVKQIDKETAAAVLQYPNFNGLLEPDMERIETAVHGVKGLLIMAVDPISLGILKPPADWGADIAWNACIRKSSPFVKGCTHAFPPFGFDNSMHIHPCLIPRTQCYNNTCIINTRSHIFLGHGRVNIDKWGVLFKGFPIWIHQDSNMPLFGDLYGFSKIPGPVATDTLYHYFSLIDSFSKRN
jgi:glycine cleavage system pyridoxal-binding protein P